MNVIRSVLNRTAGCDGQLFRTGMVPLDSAPVRASLPVWLGALGPRMLVPTGRIADGVCAERVAEYRAAGVGLPVIFPMPVGGDWGYEQAIAALGEAA